MAGVDDTSAPGANGQGSAGPHQALLRMGRALQRTKADDQTKETARRYREAHADKIREYKANWRQQNREHVKEYRARYDAANREEVLRKKREYMRSQAEKRRRKMRQRERARESERRWMAANPGKREEVIRRWREAHPEKTAEYSKRYYARHREKRLDAAREWRDKNPEKHAQAMKSWQQRNRQHLSEYQRKWREENPEAYERALASTKERQRVQRRLKALDLPPIKRVRTRARDQRANESAAREFFERRRALKERKRMLEAYEALTPSELERLRRRSVLAQRRFAQLDRFGPAIERMSQQVPQLQEDARMDSVARVMRGAGPLDVDAAIRQRVFNEAHGLGVIAAGVSPAAAAEEIEDLLLRGGAAPVNSPDGGRLIWVPAHTRSGQSVEGHWRRRRSD